jgi:thioredoxin:protein disulfide reductase
MNMRIRDLRQRPAVALAKAGVWLIGALAAAGVSGSAEAGQLVRPRAAVVPFVENDSVHAGNPVRVALQVSLPEGLHVQSNAPRDPSLIPTVLKIEPPLGITVDEVVYPTPTDLKQVGQDQPLAVFEREFAIGVRLTLPRGLPAGDLSIPLHLRYQACDSTVCYPPATADAQWSLQVVAARIPAAAARHRELFDRLSFGRVQAPAPTSSAAVATEAAPPPGDGGNGVVGLDHFTVLTTPPGAYMGSDEFVRFIHNAESGTRERGLFEGRGPLAILLIVFLGGLALNLTPCVLPMIPINLAIIGAGTQAGSRGRGFLLGSVYGAAMALVYGVLGLIVILTAGTFGTINASPWFNIGIAALFVVLGLAMFDVILIDFSGVASGFRTGDNRRGTVLLAFSMGSIAALLAGACVAPVVIQVVLFSSNLYATGTRIALALPFCLGIGMAVPWPIAGAGLAALPKPGAWMVRVKQVLGVAILGTAVYYGYLAFELLSNRWVDKAAVASSVDEKVKEGWHRSLAAGLAAAEREQKPVLIDMWATWCKNCLTMDKTTLENADVKAALSGYVKIKFQAEDPDRAPARQVMERFGAVGLPAYVILRPKAATPSS